MTLIVTLGRSGDMAPQPHLACHLACHASPRHPTWHGTPAPQARALIPPTSDSAPPPHLAADADNRQLVTTAWALGALQCGDIVTERFWVELEAGEQA